MDSVSAGLIARRVAHSTRTAAAHIPRAYKNQSDVSETNRQHPIRGIRLTTAGARAATVDASLVPVGYAVAARTYHVKSQA